MVALAQLWYAETDYLADVFEHERLCIRTSTYTCFNRAKTPTSFDVAETIYINI